MELYYASWFWPYSPQILGSVHGAENGEIDVSVRNLESNLTIMSTLRERQANVRDHEAESRKKELFVPEVLSSVPETLWDKWDKIVSGSSWYRASERSTSPVEERNDRN